MIANRGDVIGTKIREIFHADETIATLSRQYRAEEMVLSE